jgi:phosphomannomutase
MPAALRYHVPEKDGGLAGLLSCEMVSKRGNTMMEQLRAIFAKLGSFYPRRENLRLTPEVKEQFTTKLQAERREIAGRKVVEDIETMGSSSRWTMDHESATGCRESSRWCESTHKLVRKPTWKN